MYTLSPDGSEALLIVRMERSLSDLDDERQQAFVAELALLAGVLVHDIKEITFRRGCVIFMAKVDPATAAFFVEAYNSGNMPEFMKQFIASNNITFITAHTAATTKPAARPDGKWKIVFVHGWNGGPDSFGDLPSFVERRMHVECMVYEYPTRCWSSSPSLSFISRSLDNWVRNRLTDETDTVAFVAHSMGGVIVRDLLISQYWRRAPLDKQVKIVVFMASPHNGAILASIASQIPGFSKHQLAEIGPSSSFLVDLNERWGAWVRKHVPSSCAVRCLYGTSDDVVSVVNALGSDHEAVPVLNAGHRDICKPKRQDDTVPVTIARFLREAGCSESVSVS